MEAFEAVRTVLAVRSFQEKTIPTDVKTRILEAARLTGSGSNNQPWHFIAVEDRETLKQLGKVATSGPYIAQAAFAVVVLIKHNNPIAISDGSRAVQSMMLAAWADGVGSNWVGFVPMPAVSELLSIPSDLDVLAVIPFGYPTKEVGQGKKKRKAAAEVISHEKFGQP